MILNPTSIDYSQPGKIILTFAFIVGAAPTLTYAASDANRLSLNGGCEVADFSDPIVPLPSCEFVNAEAGGTPSILIITFNNIGVPDLDSANLTDFLLDGSENPISIDYSVAGQVTLTFAGGVVFAGRTLVYTATDANILSFGVCEVPNFASTVSGPE